MNKLTITKGDRYGKLTVIRESAKRILPSGQTNRFALCKCDCGNKKEIRLLHLVRFRTLSCGCIVYTRKGNGNSKLCKVWRQMKDRCSKKYFEDKYYFKKGIKVCDEWINSFDLFLKWSLENGYGDKLQIDRIDNSKGYNPNNCRWVTCKVNVNNRDNTFFVNYKGEKSAFIPLIESLNKMESMSSIRRRILRGWDHNKAIDFPIKIGNYKQKLRE